ncbi:glutathione S-transferase family protein [Caenibius sp. WL]|uniref:glutathione S-transferase family protein n=1 Tax=Caenibius sp. WL TaxID=2872646 RepID=UPI001C99A137|nr:glutathione S-transferase family protein [Caenibius sp. WL]QZP09558.1 glutathione S-transferase family protein [Caenibius sp. WL]
MPVEPDAAIEITAFDWVPGFARGFVRDLRPRWACEEIGLAYSERLINPAGPRPEGYYAEQPWGQVPVLKEDGLEIFESGAILLHLGEKDERLLPRDPQARQRAISWLFAALNSVEPLIFELSTIDIFAKGEEWAELRRPSLMAFAGQRFDRLADALGEREWLAGPFSIADIAMATVLREADKTDLVSGRANLAAYLARALSRPAFERALTAQLDAFRDTPQPAAA